MKKANESLQETSESENMRIPIVKLQLVVDKNVEYLREPLTSSGKAAEWIERSIIQHSNREHIVVVCCDAGGMATNIDVVSKGSVKYCSGTIAEIFKTAIITNAVQIIMFHNHPSGDPTPSRADREITRKVMKAGELLEIELLDHIIIGRNGAYYSFRGNNVLDG